MCVDFIRGRGKESGQAYVVSLNSMSYSLHWRPNAGLKRETLLRFAWVCLLPSNLQKVLKFIVLKDNKPSRTEHQQFTALFTEVSQARWVVHYSWDVNAYPEKAKALTPDTRNYLICQIQQPKRSELLLYAPRSNQFKMFSQEGHIHRSNTHPSFIHTYGHTDSGQTVWALLPQPAPWFG